VKSQLTFYWYIELEKFFSLIYRVAKLFDRPLYVIEKETNPASAREGRPDTLPIAICLSSLHSTFYLPYSFNTEIVLLPVSVHK